MTTQQLFHRLARNTRTGDVTKLSLTEQTDLLDSANQAIQELYSLLPTQWKEMTEGFLLPASTTASVTATKHSASFATAVFTDEQIGRSVVLTGDSNWNQIIGTTKLRNQYLGETGTVTATIYGDAVHTDKYPFDRIIGNPKYPASSPITMTNRELQPINNPDGGTWLLTESVGLPEYWWVQLMGQAQGESPMLVLRVSPAPSAAVTISVRMSFCPKRLTLDDYEDASTLVVAEQFIETALIPLATQALTMLPVWDTRRDTRRVDEAAERARIFIRRQVPNFSSMTNRIFTPIGY